MPELHLKRTKLYPTHTLGELRVLGDHGGQLFRCFSLELPWRDNKPRVSCIPTGRYRIVLEFSPAFGMHLWELKDVPNRSEVKIHVANYTRQLRGCIAPGMDLRDIDADGITDTRNSRAALDGIEEAMGNATESYITIE
jgi:hypothetical protein